MGEANSEWEVMHLTEDGWIPGGYHYDSGFRKGDVVPKGTVLSIRRNVIGALDKPSSANVDEVKTKHTTDENKTNLLLDKFGKPSFSI